jgi:Ca2+-binding EF-hand superfamily protein
MAHPQLTEEQISIFQEVFSLYDAEEDGTICTAELVKVMKCLGCDFTQEELAKLTNEVDPRQFGVLNFQQFLVMMSRNLENGPTTDERRREVFMYFDVDEKGFITASDLRQAMINLGENLTEKDIKQMIKEAAIEKDGQVSYDEFVKIVISNQENF